MVVFALVYLGMALGTAPYVKIDRTGIALLGAIVLVSGGWITEKAAWDSINTETMALLLGLMILSSQMQLSGAYQVLTKQITHFNIGPAGLLGAVVGLAGMLAAFLTNDVIALAVAPVLIHVCIERRLNPLPFLLALCCAVNAGSALTLIGSPQSMLIGQALDLDFIRFIGATIVPTLVAFGTIWGIIVWLYRGQWDAPAGTDQTNGNGVELNRFGAIKGMVVLAIVLVMFVFTKMPRELVALSAGGLLLVNRHYTTRNLLKEVDWQLLMLFIGLFVVNAAFQSTGLPHQAVDEMSKMGIDLRKPMWLFAATAVISDLFSNVPAVMLLLPYAEGEEAGVAMALGSTLASNLIIFGSLANIIVIDSAARRGIKISFWQHARVGAPITIISLAFAGLWLWLT
ncbi:transporter [Cerasicoccus arenae]|uniref:Transporter n=1 Tax=Cerasicoccus arenae TaxID=424488 RepID=A0A8J3GCY8_9BACT|nr:transporter [Cerasicoccus arenae]